MLRRDNASTGSLSETWQNLRLLDRTAALPNRRGFGPTTLTFRVNQGEATFWLLLHSLSGLVWPTSRNYETAATVRSIIHRVGDARFVYLYDPDNDQYHELAQGDEVIVRHVNGGYQFRLMPQRSR